MAKYWIPRSNIFDTEDYNNRNEPLALQALHCFICTQHIIHLLNGYVQCIVNIADMFHITGLHWNLESA